MAKLISDKIKQKTDYQQREGGDFIIINGKIHQKNVAITNIYILKNKASKCMKQKLSKLTRERVTIIEQLNTSSSEISRKYRQNISKNIGDINNTFKQIMLFDIYKTSHTTTTKSIYFSSVQRNSQDVIIE